MENIRTLRHAPERLRFEGRWVFDASSARAGFYLGDQAGDALAADAKAAIAALLEARPGLRYRTGEAVKVALGGGGGERKRAPSIVWHAQAIGVLQLGYMPSADCVTPHLEVLERRLDPENADAPSADAEDQTWTLRTRHVAWVLACLAELHARAIPSGEVPEEVAAALEHYRRVAETAFQYTGRRIRAAGLESAIVNRSGLSTGTDGESTC